MTPRKLAVRADSDGKRDRDGQVRYEGDRRDDDTQHARQRQLYQAPSPETPHRSSTYDTDQGADPRGGDHGAEGPGAPEARLGQYGPADVKGTHHGYVGTEHDQQERANHGITQNIAQSFDQLFPCTAPLSLSSGASSAGVPTGLAIRASAPKSAVATRNRRAVAPKLAPRPRSASKDPANAGPRMPLACSAPWIRAFAAPRRSLVDQGRYDRYRRGIIQRVERAQARRNDVHVPELGRVRQYQSRQQSQQQHAPYAREDHDEHGRRPVAQTPPKGIRMAPGTEATASTAPSSAPSPQSQHQPRQSD